MASRHLERLIRIRHGPVVTVTSGADALAKAGWPYSEEAVSTLSS
jgi:hypothetical protein